QSRRLQESLPPILGHLAAPQRPGRAGRCPSPATPVPFHANADRGHYRSAARVQERESPVRRECVSLDVPTKEEGKKTERWVWLLGNVDGAWKIGFYSHRRSGIFDQAEHAISRAAIHEPLLMSDAPDPSGATARRAPGTSQSRRHRIPLPLPDRRA